MSILIDEIVNMIISNMKKFSSPLPLPEKEKYKWAIDLKIPKAGHTILYTGLLYQMMPYLNASIKVLERLEESKAGKMIVKMSKIVSKIIDPSSLIKMISEKERDYQHDIIKRIAYLLKIAGINFSYLYESEMYSGVLLYDLGLDELFQQHIQTVYDVFKKYNVKNIITIDPHTTYILRAIYPKYIDGYDVEIDNYLELLSEKELKVNRKLDEKVVLHDPCYYARYEKIIDQPRKLLNNIGVKVIEPHIMTKELTFCCGGPVESISPKLAKCVAKLRIEELKELGNHIVVMCPICYVNLMRVAPSNIFIHDISTYLYHAYG